jgi:fermentation-respiration switch protein FrsA (DUF1100 family)
MTTPPLPPLRADQAEVLRTLGTWRNDYRPYLRTVARDCALPAERVRAVIRYFHSLGWVTYGQVFDTDTALVAGSTWWLTEKGCAARDQLNAEGMA